MIATLCKMPPLSAEDSARLRLAIGGTRAWEALEHRQSLVRSFNDNQSRGMGIANMTSQSRDTRAAADEALSRELAALGLSTPDQLGTLMTKQLPAMAGGTPKEVAAATAAPLNTVLKNIAKVRKEIGSDDLKVWNNRAVSLAMVEMGIAGQPEMRSSARRSTSARCSGRFDRWPRLRWRQARSATSPGSRARSCRRPPSGW